MPQFFFVEEGMIQKRLFRWESMGFFFVSVVGTVLHFVYDWSGGNGLVAAFSAVNESVWEHMKLLFVSMLLFSLLQCLLERRQYPNFWAVRAVSVWVGVALIPVLFYTYSGIWGQTVDWVNILIYYVSAWAAFWLDGHLLREGALCGPWKQLLGWAALWLLALAFLWCTWHPVELPLWQDPVTGTYGMR